MRIWLTNQISTYAASITDSLILLVAVIVAIPVIIMFLRHLSIRNLNIRNKYPLRLTICDTIAIDQTRRLILIRRDNTEHLILIGGQTDIIIESNITGDENSAHANAFKPQQHIQPTLTVPNQCHNSEEKVPFLMNEMQNDVPAPLSNQPLKDSVITAEIEGRQEPSLSIPIQNK
ncbi:hypothetical protein [Bartonella sp. CB189]|uniref:hypothetical protein n=1 Tax=Bartonella sp. CB189 TaxID=3112254 RepID=UPI002F96DE7E